MTLVEMFEKLDWTGIELLIQKKQEEHLHLDFKTVNNSELTNKDDKRNFAKAVSGFGNSNGGIVIWGVDARKNQEGVDCAEAIVELTNPALLVTRLNTLSGEATSPIVDGLRHEPIVNPATGRGVVATLVPESDGGPYMAKLGEQRYYKRSGDSFYQMEHFDLEDMFGRRRRPKLQLTLEVAKTQGEQYEFTLRYTNMGRAVAKHAGLVARFGNADLVGCGDGFENLSGINSGHPVVKYENAIGVIHPNGIRVNLGNISLRRQNPAQPITMDVTVYCEGAPTLNRAVSISAATPSLAIT